MESLPKHVTHRSCKCLIAVIGICIRRSSYVRLGVGVSIRESGACPRMVPGEIIMEGSVAMRPSFVHDILIRVFPALYPRKQCGDPRNVARLS
jgi:hypothetical protein